MEDNLGWRWHWVTETITLILMQILLLLFFCHLTWASSLKEVMIIQKKSVRMDIRWCVLSLHMHLMWDSSGHCSLRFKVGQVISNPLCFPSSHPLMLVQNPHPCHKPLGCPWCVQGCPLRAHRGAWSAAAGFCCVLLPLGQLCVCLCWMSPFPQGTDPAPQGVTKTAGNFGGAHAWRPGHGWRELLSPLCASPKPSCPQLLP